jgi:hypothetical protein
MANKKVSELLQADPLTGDELVMVVQGGESLRAPASSWELNVQHNTTATTDPDVTDDSSAGYAIRSTWINTSTHEIFRCLDASVGAAVWVKTSLTLDELGGAATKDIGTTAGTVADGTASTAVGTSFDNAATSFAATDAQALGEEIDGLISEVTATHKFTLDANGVLILEEL